jgi:hypothetical protein
LSCLAAHVGDRVRNRESSQASKQIPQNGYSRHTRRDLPLSSSEVRSKRDFRTSAKAVGVAAPAVIEPHVATDAPAQFLAAA